jgi:hypothetical protein
MRRVSRAWVPLVTLVASAVVPAASGEAPPDPTRRPGSSPRG